MATVSVLYIDDLVVAPHLELMRNVCQPNSTSRPHITVRYFDRLKVPPDHLRTHVAYVDLIEPGAFGFDEEAEDTNKVAFIRCDSEALLHLEHKPHHPASEFHITIYDGPSAVFAKSLLRVLRGFPWHFRVPLVDGTLVAITVKDKRTSGRRLPRRYRQEVRQLFTSVTGLQLSYGLLDSLDSRDRLELCRDVCDNLHKVAANLRLFGPGQRTDRVTRVSVGRLNLPEPEIHVTPPELAKEVAAYALSQLKVAEARIRFGDPAVGNGAFFSALLQATPKKRIESAVGVDVSRRQVSVARSRWSRLGMDVILGDYLHMNELPPRNLILANPPYLRHQGIGAEQKQALRSRASAVSGIPVSARSGLYVYFLLLSHQWMEPGAVAAWLIPSEFMQTTYGKALRRYLTERVETIRIHAFGHDDPQFEAVHVLPSVVVFRNNVPRSGHEVLLTSGGSVEKPWHREWATVDQLRHDRKWSVPRRQVREVSTEDVTIGDLFTVRRGIATGANEFFIMDRRDAVSLRVPKSMLRPMLPKARTLKNDIVLSDEDGYPRISPQLVLLDCDLSEEEVKARYPNLNAYLEAGRKSGIANGYLVSHRSPWYKQESRDPAPFLCTYMGRGRKGGPPLRFIWNKSQAVATNTYIMLYPSVQLDAITRGNEKRLAELFSILRITAETGFGDDLRVHAGGLFKMEPGELRQVRISAPPNWLRAVASKRIL